jgi:hypothetical protein
MSSVTFKINVFIFVRITRDIVHVVVFTIDYCHMFVFILVRITRGIVHVVVFTIDYCHVFVFITNTFFIGK